MRVYVAGPYTKGDVAQNVRDAILAADQLLQAGHAPFLPHLTHFWHLLTPHPWERWLNLDLEWLLLCHALVRLPGESVGADREVQYAMDHGLPIFIGVANFLSGKEWI